jgi:hypothetical protein
MFKSVDELIQDIIDNNGTVERVMFGRDDSEIRVIYRPEGRKKYRVRALIEMNEDSRAYYDQIVRDTLMEAVVTCEADIAACYE